MALAPPDPDVYGHRPTASFAPVENNIDVAVLLDGSGSSDPDGDVLQYRWDFDDDGFWDTAWSFSSTIYHTWGEEYDGNVLLEVFDGRYKDVHRMAVDISGIRPPVAFKFEPVLRDATYELKFTDISPFKSKDIIAWDWDFGGKETSTEKDPVIRLKDEGTYDVKLTLRYRDGTTKTYTKSIEISDPKANFTWSPDIQIEGEAVQFKDLSSSLSSKISTWLWDFGDGSTSKEQNPKHVYYDDGTYKVTLTVTNGDRSKDSITLSVTVQDLSPVAAYSYSPKPQYVGEPVSFIDLSASSPDNIVSWNWNFGDGTTSNDQNPEHIFKETGVYEVRLTVTDEDGSIDAISYRVVINETPSTEKPSTQHSLQIRIEGNGKTDPAPGVAHTYETDSSVQLSAYPAEGWKFSHWSIGVETKTDNPLHWILKEDTKVTAVFVEEQAVTYSVIIEVQGSGTTDPVPGTYELEEGHQLSVKAIPEEGWEFSGWLVNGESAGDTSTLFADITQDHEIVALFLEEIVEQHEEVTKSSDPLSNLINAIKEFFASLFNIFG
jgi:PKD repeat protein